MTSLADTIRAHIFQQDDAVQDIWTRAQNFHACHNALLAVLDEHQPCEPPRQLLCNGCRHLRPCPTEQAISAAFGIKAEP